MAKNEELKNGGVFPIGEPNDAYAENFTGQSYLQPLVNDSEVNVGIGNVTFEPQCRTNWHKHHKGYQIIMITGGEGWYQEKGQPAKKLVTGDVVTIHNGVNHWHGATKDSWFTHIAITAGEVEWLEEVTDEEYIDLDSE